MNYARRQQYRRISRAGAAAVGSAVALLLALLVASIGAVSVAGLLLLVALVLGLYTRHWLVLPGTSSFWLAAAGWGPARGRGAECTIDADREGCE